MQKSLNKKDAASIVNAKNHQLIITLLSNQNH
jgi:hypothetical protein